MVEPHHPERAKRVEHFGLDPRRLAQLRHQIGQRIFPPVDFAALQGGRCGRRIRHDLPFNPIEIGDLAAGPHRRRFLTRHIAGIARIGGRGARHPFVAQERVRPGSDIFGDHGKGIGLGDAFRHDETAFATQHISGDREALFHPELQALIVERHQFVAARHQGAAHRVALGPSDNRLHAVRRPHRDAIGKLKSVA